MRPFILAFALFCAAAVTAGQEVLTNDDVARMVQAGVAQDLIIKTIAESAVQFQLKADQLIALKKAGVPDDIVRAMTARSSQNITFRRVPFSSEEQVVRSADAVAIPAGSKVYVAAAVGFDTYLSAALRKNRVAVVVVTGKDKADYELSGVSDAQATVRLVNLKTREVVFAYAVSKKEAKHGPQTAAEVCARHMKEAVAGD